MTSPETTVLRQRLGRVITPRVGSSAGASAVAAATRQAHDDLAAVLAPLISSAGVEALWRRASDLARREYAAEERRGDNGTAEEDPAQVTLWLESQVPSVATDAAAAILSAFAQLLTALIGETLTTRYLGKAWPDGFPDAEVQPKRKKT